MLLPKRKGRKTKRANQDVKPRTRRVTVTKADMEFEAERLMMLDSFAEFCKGAWHVIEPSTTYQHNWHIDVICAHLEALFWARPATSGPNAGRPVRNLVINIPPRHMKSLICSVMFPAWCWAHDPGRRFFCSSYAQSLAEDHAAGTMRLVTSEWYQLRFGATGNPYLDGDGNYVALQGKRQVKHFETSAGGARQSTSVTGKTTGAGGDILTADDPHNVIDKESDRKMARVIVWWSRSMASRGNDPKSFCRLVVMQRVAEDDLAGWCINQGYDLLLIPARYEGAKDIGVLGHKDPRTVDGEPMWPTRYGDSELTDLERSLQEDSAGQLQQRPAPPGGRNFAMGSIKNITARIRDALLKPGVLDELIMVWDMASKGRSQRNKKRSWTVGAVWGRKGNAAFLFDVWRGQVRFTEQVEGIEFMARKWPQARPIYIEDKASGTHAADMLESKIPGVMMIEPKGDKDIRARNVSPFFKAGNIWVLDESLAEWVTPWRREHEYFPNAAADDQVDTTSMALDLLLVGGWATPTMPEGSSMKALDLTTPGGRAAAEAQAMAVSRRRRQNFEDEEPPLPVVKLTGG